MPTENTQVAPFKRLVEAIVSGNEDEAVNMLVSSPLLATYSTSKGATARDSSEWFFDQIGRYMYVGDTALHMAAASYQTIIVEKLVAMNSDVRARNRRGAEPIHYAVDGGPGLPGWNPNARAKVIGTLVDAGADPNAVDKGGVAPLHCAIRSRCASAVEALLEVGADPKARNKSGSTPMLLATRSTGRGGSGSHAAKEQQEVIIHLLAKYNAA